MRARVRVSSMRARACVRVRYACARVCECPVCLGTRVCVSGMLVRACPVCLRTRERVSSMLVLVRVSSMLVRACVRVSGLRAHPREHNRHNANLVECRRRH